MSFPFVLREGPSSQSVPSLFLSGVNVRVGLEDNLYLGKGDKAKSNAEQVERIVRMANELGLEPASPNQAREFLGLKGLEKG